MSSDASDRPSAWLVGHAELLPATGRALDLAAGGGRNSRWLAQRGLQVLGLDCDVTNLSGIDGVEPFEVDLESGASLSDCLAGAGPFDCIVVCNYLHRPLLTELPDLLAAEGVLVYETFASGNERFGRPRNPDFLLGENELLDVFAQGLVVLAFEYGEEAGRSGRAVRQKIIARRRS